MPGAVFAVDRFASCDLCGLCTNPEYDRGFDPADTSERANRIRTLFKTLKLEDGTIGRFVPGNWGYCAHCLYEGVPEFTNGMDVMNFADVHHEKTLLVGEDDTKPNFNRPPRPLPGKYYTQFGCLGEGGQLTESEFASQNISASIITRLLGVVQGITGAIGFLYLLYGIFLLLTSRGDPDQLNAGKKAIRTAIAGTLFAILSVFVIQFLVVSVLRVPNIGN